MKPRLLYLLISLLSTFPFAISAQDDSDLSGYYRRLDSLERMLTGDTPTESDKMSVCYELMWEYLGINIGKSMDFAHKCLEAAVSLDEWKTAADCHILLGIALSGSAHYDDAMESYLEALATTERMREFPKKYSEENIDDESALIDGNIANLYNARGEYHSAIDYYMRAIRLFEKHDRIHNLAIAYGSIGSIYRTLGNMEQAEVNLLRADSLSHATGDSLQISISKEQMSNFYYATAEYDKALHSALIAYNYRLAHPEASENDAAILTTLAQIYLEGFRDDSKAGEYARQALKVAGEIGLVREKAVALAVLAGVSLRRGEYRQAERTALEALAIDSTSLSSTFPLYEILSKTYSWLGKPALAVRYFDRYDDLRNSWSTKYYQSAIREMEVVYETEKKEARISALSRERRLYSTLSIAGGLGALLLIVFLLLYNRYLRLKRLRVQEQLEKAEQEKQLVAAESLLDGENHERERLSRELHDGLGGLLTMIKLDLAQIKTTIAKESKKIDDAIGLMDKSIHEMRRLAHNLMPESLARFGLKPVLEEFCSGSERVAFHFFGEEKRFDEKIEVNIYRIACELINNALKHSDATAIDVQLIQTSDKLSITVSDNGRGINEADEKEGLKTVRSRVELLRATMNVYSKPGAGAEITVETDIKPTEA